MNSDFFEQFSTADHFTTLDCLTADKNFIFGSPSDHRVDQIERSNRQQEYPSHELQHLCTAMYQIQRYKTERMWSCVSSAFAFPINSKFIMINIITVPVEEESIINLHGLN